jgi:SHS family sialic acid transporter-like MFS transporter
VFWGAAAPYIVLSTISAANITMRTGMMLFIGVGLAFGLLLLLFARETRGLSINDVDAEIHESDVVPVGAA